MSRGPKPAALLDPRNLVYSAKRGRVAPVTVGGHPWERAGDYPTFDALVGADLPAGAYATCVALGMVRLGSAPPEGMPVVTR